MRPLPCLLAVVLSSMVQSTPPQRPAAAGILEAEWTFIRHCEWAGIKASFIEAFHADGLIFRPEPANGRDWYGRQPESKARLAWAPAVSFTAASDELGWNAGPWTWKPGPGSEPKAFGWFFSVWKRDPGGAWKLFWDIGMSTGEPAAGVPELRASGPARRPVAAVVPLSEAQALDLDRMFIAKARTEGLERAYRCYLAPAGRVFRSPSQPATGWTSAQGLLAASTGARTWEPRGAAVARSGELLFVQGGYSRTREAKAAETGSYVRVWRRLGTAWTLELDLESPQPPKEK